jgi:hypothetical protein
MRKTVHFANILLSSYHPIGRMHIPNRKKGDWFHSISVFTSEDINCLPIGGQFVKCTVIHFFGHNGSPVLDMTDTTIRCVRNHMGKKLYNVSDWSNDVAVIGDIRTLNGYEPGYGSTETSINDIKSAAIGKWGNGKIPYTHQRNESYNCIAFSDDILVWATKNVWNPRIENMHEKYGLYI